MSDQESGSQENVSSGKRRKRGKAASSVAYKKYAWKTSSSAVSTDDSDRETAHCSESMNEPHVCSETDVFSESTTPGDFTDSEAENEESGQSDILYSESTTSGKQNSDSDSEAEVKLKKKRRKRKRFLSQRKSTGRKTVGNLQVVCSNGRVQEDSSSDENDTDVDLTGLEVADVEAILEVCAANLDEQQSTEEPAVISPVVPPVEEAADTKDNEAAGTPQIEDSTKLVETIKDLSNNLKLLLSDMWSVSLVEGHLLRLSKLSSAENAFVEFCVFYDLIEKKIGIFVHGIPVSSENKVFQCSNVPNSNNLGSVSDFLCELTSRLEDMEVCCGILEHEDFWNTSKGFVDYSGLKPHFRSGTCDLVIQLGATTCQSCKEELRKLERHSIRGKGKKRDRSTDTTPDKYLSSEDMVKKKNEYKKKYRSEKQRAARLEKKLNKMKVKLDEALRDELSSILTLNQHKMTPLQKLFWEQQCKALSLNDTRGMRWHPMMIRLALHLHSLSDNAYTFLGESKILVLPSKRRLYDYSHFTEPQEGCQEEFLQHVLEKIEKCGTEDHYSYVNLMFDEMHIRSGLVVRRSTGELIGFTKLTDCEEELQKMQDAIESKTYKPPMARKVLAYLINGITSNVKDIVAIYSTENLSASQLYDRTWEVIYHLEDAGIKVLSLTCDGASVNRKFLFMHESLNEEVKFTFCTKNLAAGSRPLFFILDPPHLLKTIRNALGNSFSHRKSRKMWKNNEYLSWKVIEELYKLTENDKFRTHKLTKAHIKLTSFSCMTVLFATQVFSNSVAKSIEELAGHEKMKMFQTTELVKFIRLMNRFFDCLNGKEELGEEGTEPTNLDKANYTKLDDPRFDFLIHEFLNYFASWKEDIKNRPGMFSESEKSRMIISHQGLGALEITIHGIIGAIKYILSAGAPSVSARVFNQDPLEQYFSKIRRSLGDNRNPSLKAFHDSRLNLHAQGLIAAPSQRGNTTCQKRKDIEVDSTPLPVRKIKK